MLNLKVTLFLCKVSALIAEGIQLCPKIDSLNTSLSTVLSRLQNVVGLRSLIVRTYEWRGECVNGEKNVQVINGLENMVLV